MLRYLLADVRYAARRLRMRTGYTMLSVLTLALGIGGTAAIFGIARPIIFDPLPYSNEKEVTSFWFDGSWTEEEFLYLRDKFSGYRRVAAHRPGDFTMRGGDAPAQLVTGLSSSWELFDVLGAAPMMGRTFREGDDTQGAEPVAVISYGLWQDLGGTDKVLGMSVEIDGTPRTVVGVMPKGFWYPNPAVRIWVARALDPEGRNGSYTFIGHVAEGEDPNSMQGHAARLASVLDERFDYSVDWDKTKNAYVTPIREKLLGSMRPAVLATFAAMALILLIACTNVAALMLGQVESRGSELAVRAALGASRRRLTQPLVMEALLIGLLSAVLGALLAVAGFNALSRALPIGAWAESATFDWSLFGAALAVAIVAALLVVFIPSTSLIRNEARGDLHAALGRTRTGGVGGSRGRLERSLVVLEVALAMLIASGATLLVRSVSNLYAIDPGLEREGLAVVDAFASSTMPTPERRARVDALVDELSQMPGVSGAAATMKGPLRGRGDSFGFSVEGSSEPPTDTYFRIVTPGYFQVAGMKLLNGRTFETTDQPTPGEVLVVVNEALAKKYFPGQDPIGKRVRGGFNVSQRIIGVVADAAEADLTDERTPVRYFLHRQVAWFGTRVTLLVRTSSTADEAAVLDAARKTVNRVAPDLAVQGTTTMSRIFDIAVGPARQVMALLALLSTLALVLGAIGIYGVISHFAQRRKRDWAIRVALGLPGRSVVTHIVGQGAVLVIAGIALGAVATVAMARLLSTFLYGVSTVDPLAFAMASGALLLAGVVASFVPARRAGTVDPALVLREDA